MAASVPQILLGLLLDSVFVMVNMAVLTSIVLIGSGPLFVGAVVEDWCDFEIVGILKQEKQSGEIRGLEGTNEIHSMTSSSHLSVNERIRLAVALLCVNIDNGTGNPQDAITEALLLSCSDGDKRTLTLRTTQFVLKAFLRSEQVWLSRWYTHCIFCWRRRL